ncbi:hypothetical protein NE865_13043 [Phthorimaea operculella]|nr:hypothetical protein NE865_13043 [Phthorimaea operculella]
MVPYGPEPIIPIPAGKFRSLLRERTKNEHNTYWTGLEDCRQAREAMPKLSSRLSKKLLRLKKPQLRMLTSIITGHGHFNKHLSVIGVTDSPLCRACMEEEETAVHVVLHCKEVATYRAKYLGNPGSIPEALSDLVGLLSFLGELGWLE